MTSELSPNFDAARIPLNAELRTSTPRVAWGNGTSTQMLDATSFIQACSANSWLSP